MLKYSEQRLDKVCSEKIFVLISRKTKARLYKFR